MRLRTAVTFWAVGTVIVLSWLSLAAGRLAERGESINLTSLRQESGSLEKTPIGLFSGLLVGVAMAVFIAKDKKLLATAEKRLLLGIVIFSILSTLVVFFW